jgi:hydrogenase maturation protease
MSRQAPVHIDTELLVIGYGNSLRGDDGIGPVVAEAVNCLNLPGVRTLCCPLLAPELADTISRAREVIFVDASAEPLEGVRWQKLTPGDTSQLMAHSADPRTLLALARDIFGHAPKAWWLTLPAVDMGFHTGLSHDAEEHCYVAVRMIRNFHCPHEQHPNPQPGPGVQPR